MKSNCSNIIYYNKKGVFTSANSISVDVENGSIKANEPGTHEVVAICIGEGGKRHSRTFEVFVNYPKIKKVTLKLDDNSLVEFAGSGEKASAGSIHYDNVAASVLGGFVIVKTDPLYVIRIEPPTNLRMCISVPEIIVPKKKTKVSRGVIPKKVNFSNSVFDCWWSYIVSHSEQVEIMITQYHFECLAQVFAKANSL